MGFHGTALAPSWRHAEVASHSGLQEQLPIDVHSLLLFWFAPTCLGFKPYEMHHPSKHRFTEKQRAPN